MSDSFGSAWIAIAALIALSAVGRLMRGSWLSPAAFVSQVWTGYASFSMLLTDYELYSEGLWVVVLFVFCIQLGAILTQGIGREKSNITPDAALGGAMLGNWEVRSFRFMILFTSVAMIGTVHLLFYSLDKFSLGFSFVDLLALGNLWSVARYGKGELEPWSVRLLIMWIYPAALLGGICFASSTRRMVKILSFIPLVPAALVGTVFAARAGLLMSSICWCSANLAVRFHLTAGRYALFRKKLVVVMLLLAIGAFLFFVAIDTLRAFSGDAVVEARVDSPRILKYFFGSLPAFCSWVHYTHTIEPTWGAYTFSGVFDLLNLKHREIGVYGEMQTLLGGEETNIYTIFRGLIQDFTVLGTAVFGVVMGALAGSAARLHVKNITSILALSAFYALILSSPLVSLFVYNGLILAWVAAAVILGWRFSRDEAFAVRKVRV